MVLGGLADGPTVVIRQSRQNLNTIKITDAIGHTQWRMSGDAYVNLDFSGIHLRRSTLSFLFGLCWAGASAGTLLHFHLFIQGRNADPAFQWQERSGKPRSRNIG